MSRGLLWVLCVTCGVAVGNVYFPQAVSPLVADGLTISPDRAALVVTAAQVGYAVGIFFLVPLGDRLPHRPLIVALLCLTALGLTGAAAAQGLPTIVGAGVLSGVTSVVAPIAGPMAAGLVEPDRRGAVSGALLAGSVGGMLLSRAVAGTLGEHLGWRAPYLVSAAVTLVLAAVLAKALPKTTPTTGQPYPVLITEPLRILGQEPDLRRSCFYQATIFGAFTAIWTGIALLVTGPVYGLGADVAGLIAVVGAATMVATPIAGRIADRRGPDRVNTVCMIAVIASAGVLALGQLGGPTGLAALIAGTLVLDVAMQSGMVANQVRNYALRPDARARVNTAYMTCAYAGGSAGSALGAQAYAHLGWLGTTGLAALLGAAALTRHLTPARSPSTRSAGT